MKLKTISRNGEHEKKCGYKVFKCKMCFCDDFHIPVCCIPAKSLRLKRRCVHNVIGNIRNIKKKKCWVLFSQWYWIKYTCPFFGSTNCYNFSLETYLIAKGPWIITKCVWLIFFLHPRNIETQYKDHFVGCILFCRSFSSTSS